MKTSQINQSISPVWKMYENQITLREKTARNIGNSAITHQKSYFSSTCLHSKLHDLDTRNRLKNLLIQILRSRIAQRGKNYDRWIQKSSLNSRFTGIGCHWELVEKKSLKWIKNDPKSSILKKEWKWLEILEKRIKSCEFYWNGCVVNFEQNGKW